MQKLTKPQKTLLASLKADGGEPTHWIELFPGEIRTARALEARGLIELSDETLPSARLTPAAFEHA